MAAERSGPPQVIRLIGVAVAALVLGLALLSSGMYALHDPKPHGVPIGIAAPAQVADRIEAGLERQAPGGFAVKRYVDDGAARAGVGSREVYGALSVGRGGATVYTASALGSTSTLVSTVLTRLARAATPPPGTAPQPGAALGGQPGVSPGEQPGTSAGAAGAGPGAPRTTAAAPRVVDVVPASAGDPRGIAPGQVLFGSVFAGLLAGALSTVLIARTSRGLWLLAPVVVGGLYGPAAAWTLGPHGFDVLPGDAVRLSITLGLVVAVVMATVSGLGRLLGGAGIGLAALTVVVVGNSASGATLAWQFLPDVYRHVAPYLPNGAGAIAVNSMAFFDGAGSAKAFTVLGAYLLGGYLCLLLAAAFRRGDGPAPDDPAPSSEPDGRHAAQPLEPRGSVVGS